MDGITLVYLIFMFIALYFFSFFITLTVRNKKDLYSYPEPDTSHFISVILPAYNEQDSIADTIRHVCESDYPKDKLEVIVVSDGSKDGTINVVKEMMKRYSNVRLLDKENSGKADSVNRGISIAKGDLVAVVDCDSFPEKESITKLSGYFRDAKMAAVTSFVSVRNKNANFLAKIQSLEYLIMAWSRKLLDYIDSVYVTNGPLSLYRKKFIMKLGGFDKKSITEDIDITWNCLYHGYKTAMCLDARVSTVAPSKFKKWYRQRVRWGLGGLQALFKYRKMFFKKGMFGMFIMPYVTFSVVLSIATFIFSIYLIAKALLIRFLSAGYSLYGNVPLISIDRFSFAPSVILIYFAMLFVLSITYSFYILKNLDPHKTLSQTSLWIFLFG